MILTYHFTVSTCVHVLGIIVTFEDLGKNCIKDVTCIRGKMGGEIVKIQLQGMRLE